MSTWVACNMCVCVCVCVQYTHTCLQSSINSSTLLKYPLLFLCILSPGCWHGLCPSRVCLFTSRMCPSPRHKNQSGISPQPFGSQHVYTFIHSLSYYRGSPPDGNTRQMINALSSSIFILLSPFLYTFLFLFLFSLPDCHHLPLRQDVRQSFYKAMNLCQLNKNVKRKLSVLFFFMSCIAFCVSL